MKSTVCILAFLAMSAAASFRETASFDRTLPTTGLVSIDVRSDAGGIDIKPNLGLSSVRVHAVIRPLRGKLDLGLAQANIEELRRNPPIEWSGGEIRIGYAKPELLKNVSMHIELEVPHETAVRAHSSSGGIRIDGIVGPVSTETSSGHTEVSNIERDALINTGSGATGLRNIGGHVSAHSESGGIQLASARGSVELQTTSGRTEVSDVSGELRSRTQSGSISIDNAQGSVTATNKSGSIDVFEIRGSVEAHTTSGAIKISQVSPAPIRASTHSGAITVDLASGRGYSIDAESRSGKVSGPPNSKLASLPGIHHLNQEISGGGPLVALETRSSKIEIN